MPSGKLFCEESDDVARDLLRRGGDVGAQTVGLTVCAETVGADDLDPGSRELADDIRLRQPHDHAVDILVEQTQADAAERGLVRVGDADDLGLIAQVLHGVEEARAHDAVGWVILQYERERQTLDGGVILRRGRGIAGDDVGDGDEQLPPVDGRAHQRRQTAGEHIGPETDAGELIDRVLRRLVDAQRGDGDIVWDAQPCLQQMVGRLHGGAVGGAEDGGDVVLPHDLGQVRPDVRVAARVHDDLHRVERQVHLQNLPLKAAEDDQVLVGGEVLIDIYKVPMAQLRQPAHEAVGRGGIVPADVEKRLAAEIAVQHQDIRGGGGDQIELAAVELVEGDEQHAAGELGGEILHELLQREDVQLRALLRGKVRDALQQGGRRHPQPGAGDEHDGARIGARPGGRSIS